MLIVDQTDKIITNYTPHHDVVYLGWLARYHSAVTLESLSNAVAVSSSHPHDGFLSGC